jgi:hypothetical protein
MMSYSVAFWHYAGESFRLNAVSVERLAADLGINRQYLTKVAKKMDWEKSSKTPRLANLQRRLDFRTNHSLEKAHIEELKIAIHNTTAAYNRGVMTARLFRDNRFKSMSDVEIYLKQRKIELIDLLAEQWDEIHNPHLPRRSVAERRAAR